MCAQRCSYPSTAPAQQHSLCSDHLCPHALSHPRCAHDHQVHGALPPTFTQMKELRVLSLVQTAITGTLPDDIGLKMPLIEHIDMDHNRLLGGTLPSSLSNLKLWFLELQRSNFSGMLPPLDFGPIFDCSLTDMQFACPLPEGAAEACGAVCA